jgi:hypothetical protein
LRRSAIAVVVTTTILLVAGCGDDDDSGDGGAETTAALELEPAAKQAGCELMLDLPDEIKPYVREHGTGHLEQGDPEPKYETTPPTSGPHDDIATLDGAYDKPQPPTEVVHALEHGRIVIQYQPDLPEEAKQALLEFYDADPTGLILFPNPDMPYDVAATAWTHLIGCEGYAEETVAAIAAFRDEFVGQGPEAVPL